MPRTWNRRRPRAARLQHRSHAASSRRDRHQGRPWCPRDCHPRSSRLARRQGPRGAAQHLAAAARARAKQPRKYLAVHAPELAVEPHLQILRRHRRSLLLRLEHPHRSALENHVHRLPRLGDRRSLFVRVGITRLARKLRPKGKSSIKTLGSLLRTKEIEKADKPLSPQGESSAFLSFPEYAASRVS